MDMDTFVPSVLQAEIGTALATEKENAEQLLLLSCLPSEKQECRLSRPSLRTTAPSCLPLDIKNSLKEDWAGRGGVAVCFGLLLWGFLLGFWDFGFLKWEALEGKRIAKGGK
jgi:hypothetical protein